MKYNLEQEDFEEHLTNQLQFLQSSNKVFDDGSETEAIRIAQILRVLLHDTKSGKSLLKSLDLKKRIVFCNSKFPSWGCGRFLGLIMQPIQDCAYTPMGFFHPMTS
jgi:hypothetical protein